MIDQVDDQLTRWVTSVLPTVRVRLGDATAPGDAAPSVGLELFELAQAPPARGPKRAPLQVHLRYLVTTRAGDVLEEHRMLGELLFSAMEQQGFEVELGEARAALWAALGRGPLPAFVLKVPLRRMRPEPPVKWVRERLVTRQTQLEPFYGLVLGPEDLPISGAIVQLPRLGVSARTDVHGRFRFAQLPAGAASRELEVLARGQQFSVSVTPPWPTPFIIRFTPKEL